MPISTTTSAIQPDFVELHRRDCGCASCFPPHGKNGTSCSASEILMIPRDLWLRYNKPVDIESYYNELFQNNQSLI